MELRYWQYHFTRVQKGRDLAQTTALTQLGFNGWEAYAVQPDPDGLDDWIIFLKREVDQDTAQRAMPREGV